jgi:hypothetical protein
MYGLFMVDPPREQNLLYAERSPTPIFIYADL